MEIDFRPTLQTDFCGYEQLAEKVLKPICGNRYEQKTTPEDWIETTEKQSAAKRANIVAIRKMAVINNLEGSDIEVFDITMSDNCKIARSRVGIQQILRSTLFPFGHAFMIFHYENIENRSWRFSYFFKGKNAANTTDAHRYTYSFGRGIPARTANERFNVLMHSDWKDSAITNAFDVEALSDEFFKDYKLQYEKFCDFVYKSKVDPEFFGQEFATYDDKTVRDYVKKMLGRIVFLHFLQKKGWMGIPANNSDWTGGDLNFMQTLYNKANDEQKSNFLDNVLEPLFFNCLNEKRDNDIFDTKVESIGKVKIPYLNGGLFEKDVIDMPDSKFPSEYFANLFELFSQYNFTIDENDPNDAEVGVDPEMLGKIFENLLEDNKDKGAFYTPKEIVQYMCRESLIAYLTERCRDGVHTVSTNTNENAIRAFVTTHQLSENISAKEIEKLQNALYSVKICDPAIGSGAFPMGLLNELFACRMALNGKDGVHTVSTDNAAKIKREIIQNNIYGVDIEKGAVDIARLRFWLALVVDETEPQPLPNLDYKIMQGNSLLESYEGFDLSQITDSIDSKAKKTAGMYSLEFDETQTAHSIQLLMKKYFEITDHNCKSDLRRQIDEQVKQHIILCSGNTPEIIEKVNAINPDNKPFFLWHTYFADVFNPPTDCNNSGGFDIVIGNPPYIRRTSLSQDMKKEYEKLYKSAHKQYDLYLLFIERGLSILKKNAILSFINPIRFFNANYGRNCRQLIIQNHTLRKVVDVSQIDIFKNAMTYPCILLIENSKWLIDSNLISYQNLQSINDFSVIDSIPIINVSQRDIREDINCKIIITKDNVTANIIGTINAKSEMVNKWFDVARGLANNKVDFKIPLCYALKSTNVKKYSITGELRKVCTDYIETFKDEMIIFPRTVLYLQATLKEKDIILLDRIYYLIKRGKINLKYALGILNAKITNFWFEYYYNTTKVSGNYFDLNGLQIKSIPIPTATPTQQQPIIALVEKILAAKKQNPQAETSAAEAEIDRLVYELYGLTEEEIKVVEGK
ncbi:MAG: Eco57I restriction-modification methylase domain-containing protein [Paludibacteraceae bacterium]|nr:Eco57I restriction-modification methylase domain-containing protein [Paludibacteraceae bacterium]